MSIFSSDYEEKEEDPIVANRIFINHVDQYHARHIAEYLTDQPHGALKMASAEVGGEGEEDTEVKRHSADKQSNKYEIIGTVKHRFGKITEDILYTILESDKETYIKEIMNCGYIIFDISRDPEEIPKAISVLNELEIEINKWMAEGPKTFKRHDRTYFFILISSVMTWGKTKPIDPQDPSVAFTESDYKKRKAHENYAYQIACEREVVLKGRKYKDKLKTYVICSGITYGFEEENLLFLFKMAWNNEKHLPLFLPGTNFIPLLHVQDLAKVLHAVCEFLPRKQFILAVEQTPCKLKSIIKSLAKCMGRGRMKEVSKEEAFLYNNMTQSLYDCYTINLNMEPGFIVDNLGVQFRNDLNLAQNMSTIVTEFRTSRNLIPLRIFLHGPPGSGKKTIASLICDTYGIQFITVKTMIEDTVQELRELIDEAVKLKEAKLAAVEGATADNEDVPHEGEEEEDEVDDIEGMSDKLREIETLRAGNEEGRLPDEFVIQLMKAFLARNQCQNQGYILVGYPKNMVQVKELFGGEAEGNEGEGGEAGGEGGDGVPTVQIIPTHVISLSATDEFLCERIMNIPEKDIQNTNFTEENMLRRLKTFRNDNTEDNTVLNFFDEHEIHPVIIDIMEYDSGHLHHILTDIQAHIGVPVGFEPTPEEQEELMHCRGEAEKLRDEEKRIESQLFERKALEEYQIKMEEKIQVLEGLQMEEEKLLSAQCEPIRNYLMKYVFPTLTEGLLEVARIKPLDPVDYLAEYLFKINPEGKMFDPAYTRQGELIMNIAKDIRGSK